MNRGAVEYVRTVPRNCCELCARPAERLYPTKLCIEGFDKTPIVAELCARHAGANGLPLRLPNRSMTDGASREHPQHEQLFDSLPYKTRSKRSERGREA